MEENNYLYAPTSLNLSIKRFVAHSHSFGAQLIRVHRQKRLELQQCTQIATF
jgi:hypothetical protein